MSRETIEQKASRYLSEGRLTVRSRSGHTVEATCTGGDLYRLGHAPGDGWFCDCPAFANPCAHLVALQLVVTSRGGAG